MDSPLQSGPKPWMRVMSRVLLTTMLIAAAGVLLGMYRQFRHVMATDEQPRRRAPVAERPGAWLASLQGPVTINGAHVDLMPHPAGAASATVARVASDLLAEGWQETSLTSSAKTDPRVAAITSDARLFTKACETRVALPLPWLKVVAVCTFPAGANEPPAPLLATGQARAWVDAPGGRDWAEFPRPVRSRRVMDMRFTGGGMVCYQLAATDGATVARTLRETADHMRKTGWHTEVDLLKFKAMLMRRGGSLCWLWTAGDPGVAWRCLSAMYVDERVEKGIEDGRDEA